MFLENVVVDAVDPQRLGRFWAKVLGSRTLTDAPGIFETRLSVEGGPTLDLCFQPVPEAASEPTRLSLLLSAATAVPREGSQSSAWDLDLPRAELREDPEGTPFWVAARDDGHEAASRPSQTLAADAHVPTLDALLLASSDPQRDAAFWSWLSGWRPVEPSPGDPASWQELLQHPSSRGPRLVLVPEPQPKSALKSRWHLDVRLQTETLDDVGAQVKDRGGKDLVTGWGKLRWRSFTDPSGNEFCLLPAAD